MEKLHDEQRKRNEEVYGIPSSGIPGEEDSEEGEAFQLVTPEATPEAYAAEAESEAAAEAAERSEEFDGYGFDE